MGLSDWYMDKAYYEEHGHWPEEAPKACRRPERDRFGLLKAISENREQAPMDPLPPGCNVVQAQPEEDDE